MRIFNNSEIQILSEEGYLDFIGLRKIEADEYLRFEFEDGSILECTNEHKIYLDESLCVWAELLSEGERVYSNGEYKKIKKIDEIKEKEIFYDVMNVDENNRYYCNDILVSNCEDFWTSNYPALSSSAHSKVIIISTPNGLYNLFHQLYEQARTIDEMNEYLLAVEKGGKELEEVKAKHGNKNAFVKNKFPWYVVPGRDEKWAATERANITEVKFTQEYEVEFIGSTFTLINGSTLQRLLIDTNRNPEVVDLGGRLKIYEKPQDGVSYIFGVDPSKGTGQHDSVIQVLKVISINPVIQMEQVAVFKDNKTDAYSFAQIINKMSIYYNGALIMIENNGEGSAVVHHLWWTLENQNMYCEDQSKTGMGLRASNKSRTKAVLLMKKFLEEGKLILRDSETARQLATFIEKDNGTFSGQDGTPDDLVSGLYWATYSMELDIFDEEARIIDTNNEDEIWGILADVDETDENNWI